MPGIPTFWMILWGLKGDFWSQNPKKNWGEKEELMNKVTYETCHVLSSLKFRALHSSNSDLQDFPTAVIYCLIRKIVFRLYINRMTTGERHFSKLPSPLYKTALKNPFLPCISLVLFNTAMQISIYNSEESAQKARSLFCLLFPPTYIVLQ